MGNSAKIYDSYAWNIAKMYIELKGQNKEKCFDVVYLDGAHTFIFDASALSVLKEMIALGGYIVLDDVNWSIEKSPTCNSLVNPGIKEKYTEEQMRECQIKLVKECLLDNDERYVRVDDYHRIAIYRRIK